MHRIFNAILHGITSIINQRMNGVLNLYYCINTYDESNYFETIVRDEIHLKFNYL